MKSQLTENTTVIHRTYPLAFWGDIVIDDYDG